MSDLADKLDFPQIRDENVVEFDPQFYVDCTHCRNEISLSEGNKKLQEILRTKGIFNRYKVKEVIIVSNDKGMIVRPRNGSEPFPYEDEVLYVGVDFYHPRLEKLLKKQGYEFGNSINNVDGDYYFTRDACGHLTIDDLREISLLECVERIEIEVEQK